MNTYMYYVDAARAPTALRLMQMQHTCALESSSLLHRVNSLIACMIDRTRGIRCIFTVSPISPPACMGKIFIPRIFCPVLMITQKIW